LCHRRLHYRHLIYQILISSAFSLSHRRRFCGCTRRLSSATRHPSSAVYCCAQRPCPRPRPTPSPAARHLSSAALNVAPHPCPRHRLLPTTSTAIRNDQNELAGYYTLEKTEEHLGILRTHDVVYSNFVTDLSYQLPFPALSTHELVAFCDTYRLLIREYNAPEIRMYLLGWW
jgi:hypothetical protein